MISNNDIIRRISLSASVGQCYFQLTSNQIMSRQGKFSSNDIIGTLTL